MKKLLMLSLVLPNVAWGACVGETLFSCPIQGSSKVIEMCLKDEVLTYRFGRPGQPEIELTEPVAAGTYRPWNGIGRSITEAVTFTNRDYSYDVWWSLDRLEEDRPVTGGVTIFQGEKYLAQVECAPGTVGDSFEPILTDAMRANGQCWDYASHSWQTTCD